MLTMVPQPPRLRCASCKAVPVKVEVGMPGWSGKMVRGRWKLTCPDCRANPTLAVGGGLAVAEAIPASQAIFAVFRPSQGDIAVFVEDGERGHSSSAMSLDEARRLHGALGGALKLADCASEPLSAVPGCAA